MRRISGLLISCAMAVSCWAQDATFNVATYISGSSTMVIGVRGTGGSSVSRVTSSATAPADQHMEFLASLWRNDGCAHRYMLADDNSHFAAVIAGVAPDGMLSLRLPDGSVHSFAFKEVAFL